MEGCPSCGVVAGRRPVPGGPVLETARFHVHQDVAHPVPGQMIVAARRHVRLLTDLDEGELADLLPLLRRVRQAQAEVLGIEHAHHFYNEDTKHHLHVRMVPRHPWMEAFGRSVASVRPDLLHARATMGDEAGLSRVAEALRRALREA
jgi:diadenosine tetraphosphate (Ap4A) HIT family hydrolase